MAHSDGFGAEREVDFHVQPIEEFYTSLQSLQVMHKKKYMVDIEFVVDTHIHKLEWYDVTEIIKNDRNNNIVVDKEKDVKEEMDFILSSHRRKPKIDGTKLETKNTNIVIRVA